MEKPKKFALDITPVIMTMSGDIIKLGTARWELPKGIGIEYGGDYMIYTSPIGGPLGPKLDLRYGAVDISYEPTAIPQIEHYEKEQFRSGQS